MTLNGTAKVPTGEDAWVLLFDDSSGHFYVQGPASGPVVQGGQEKSWTLPVIVSDQFHDTKPTYSALALIVPFNESARLQAQLKDQPLPPEAIPEKILDVTRQRVTLDSSVYCPVAPSK